MVTVQMFKMPFANNKFNLNQRVFVCFMSGNMTAACYGRFRGKGRYVRSWVNWGLTSKPNPKIVDVEVPESFAEMFNRVPRHSL